MFSKLKSSGSPLNQGVTQPSPLESNPISQFYEIKRQIGSAGPELAWKVFEATQRSDDKVSYHQIHFFFICIRHLLTPLLFSVEATYLTLPIPFVADF